MQHSENLPSPGEMIEDEMNEMGDESLGLGLGHHDMVGGGAEKIDIEDDGEEWDEIKDTPLAEDDLLEAEAEEI